MGSALHRTMELFGLREPVINEEPQDYDNDEPYDLEDNTAQDEYAPLLGGMPRIVTKHCTRFEDAQEIAEDFREGNPVIMNLNDMQHADARRMVDFACGLSLGCYGKLQKVTDRVFLLSPATIESLGPEAVEPGRA